jgi:hypothetical protein
MHDVISVDKANKTGDGVYTEWDKLFTFIHANFVIPQSATGNGVEHNREWQDAFNVEKDLCSPFISGAYGAPSKELYEMLTTIPPVIAEVVYPIVIARYLLRDAQIRFSHRKSCTFSEFHRRYGNMILGCN